MATLTNDDATRASPAGIRLSRLDAGGSGITPAAVKRSNVRHPLGRLPAGLDELEHAAGDARAAERELARLRREVGRLVHLTQLARHDERSHGRPSDDRASLGEVIEWARTNLAPVAASAGVTLEFSIDPWLANLPAIPVFGALLEAMRASLTEVSDDHLGLHVRHEGANIVIRLHDPSLRSIGRLLPVRATGPGAWPVWCRYVQAMRGSVLVRGAKRQAALEVRYPIERLATFNPTTRNHHKKAA